MIARAANLLAISLTLALAWGAGAFAQPASVGPGAESFRLGKLQLTALRDVVDALPNDGKVFGVDVGPAAVAQVLQKAGAPTDKIRLSIDALLVKAPGRVMLFDTGLGPAVHGALVASLAKAGVSPAQVTDVFITHGHADHVGGLTTAAGALAFPSATIHMSRREWTAMQAQKDSETLARLIATKVQPFEPGATIAPGITAVALYGHTPGHVGYEIVSGKDRLLDLGDLAHSSIVSLARPDWRLGFDADGKAGAAMRRATLTRLAASHEKVFAPHFPFPGVGQIKAVGDGFAWVPEAR
jgi:glyoxylase-like metal-dependent hydrolase (beta-lactamase superfamily II)